MFQSLMRTTFKGHLCIWLEIFLDDLCIYSWWLEHLKYLWMVFDCCILYRILLNPLKRHGATLGHVSKNEISIDFNNIKLIMELRPPTNFKGVQWFTGHTGYYRQFIYMFAKLAQPLYRLLIDFIWIDECQKAYDALKWALASAPILRVPNWIPCSYWCI